MMQTMGLGRRLLIGLVALSLVLGVSGPLVVRAQDGGEPREITDALGRTVTLDAPPTAIAPLSASIAELMFALGVEPVGVTEGIELEPAQGLPTFGTGYQLDLEALAALEPDLILANAQLQEQQLDQLEAIAPTIYVLTMTAADVPANVRLIGQATWRDVTANYLAKAYEDFLDLVTTSASTREGPSILILVGILALPNFGKSETYLGDMAARLGATNIADGNEDAGPFPGYAQLSVEAVLDADPDIILTITRGAPGAMPLPEAMSKDPVWSALTAVQEGRVYELDNRLYLESPGPRFTEAMLNLYRLFYGNGEGN